MNPVVLVGRRPDGGHRDRLWRWCEQRWEATLGWPIHQGLHTTDDRPEFCFSVATNRAARAAGDWDVAASVGADWFVADPDQVERAAALAVETGQLVFPHNETVVMDEGATETLVASGGFFADVLDLSNALGSVHPNTFSGVVLIPRALWDAIGGFDERFVGWGFEDLALVDACNAMGGGFQRNPGRLAHLWHPTDRALREESPNHGPNQVLWERYRPLRGDPVGMRRLLAEPGGPLAR